MAAYKRAREWMEHNKLHNSGSTLAYALIPKDPNDTIHDSQNAACFASIKRANRSDSYEKDAYKRKSKPISYFVMQQLARRVEEGDKLKPFEVRYLRWLTTKSPLHRAFRTKQPVVMQDRGTILWTRETPQYTFMAAVAARYVQEYPAIPEMWDKLCEFIDPVDAFILAHFLSNGGEDQEKLYASETYGGSHHCLTSGMFGKAEFKAFRKGKEYHSTDDLGEFATIQNYSGSTLNFKKGALPDRTSYGTVAGWSTAPLLPPDGVVEIIRYGGMMILLDWKNAKKWAPEWVEDNT